MIEEVSEITASFYYAGRVRPLRPGASIGLIGGNAGTVTALVKKRESKDGKTYLISCEHVLHPKSHSQLTRVVQPAMQDGPGTGSYSYIGEDVSVAGLTENEDNSIDAAILKLPKKVGVQNLMLGTNFPLIRTGAQFDVGSDVVFVGRSSGINEGKIVCTDVSKSFDYEGSGWTKQLSFSDIVCCKYKQYCLPGDSGAPVVDPISGSLIGLHFAGDKKFGFFCRIQQVFDAFNVELA